MEINKLQNQLMMCGKTSGIVKSNGRQPGRISRNYSASLPGLVRLILNKNKITFFNKKVALFKLLS